MDSKQKLAMMMKRHDASRAMKIEVKALADWLDEWAIKHLDTPKSIPHYGLFQSEWYDIVCYTTDTEKKLVKYHITNLGWKLINDSKSVFVKTYFDHNASLCLGGVTSQFCFI